MNTQEQHPVPDSPPAPASSRKSVGRHLVMVLAGLLAFVLAGGLLAALLVQMQVSQADLLRWQSVSAGIKRWGLLLQCLTLAAIGLCGGPSWIGACARATSSNTSWRR